MYSNNRQQVTEDIYIIGGASLLSLPDTLIGCTNQHLRYNGAMSCQEFIKVQVFYRAEKQNTVFYSAQYKRVKKRNSYVVLYRGRDGENKFGIIQYFFVLHTFSMPLVAMKVLKPSATSLHDHFQVTEPTIDNISPFVIPVTECDEFDVTDLGRLEEKCVYVAFSSEFVDRYVIRFPHKLHD